MRPGIKYGLPVAIGVALAGASVLFAAKAPAIGGAATVLLTAVLVSITWYYADETRILRREAQTSRLFSLPLIRLSATLTSEPHILIRNIGQGFAADLTITVTETSTGREPSVRSIVIPALGPGEGVEFAPHTHVFRSVNGFLLRDKSIVFRATGTYTDPAHVPHTVEDDFSLSDFINSCEDLGVEFADDGRFDRAIESREQKEFQKSITEGLRRIGDAISRFR